MKMSWSCRKETWSVSWRDAMMVGLWVCVIDHCIDSPLHRLSHTKSIRIYYRALFWSCMFSFYLYPDSYVCTGFSVQVHPRGQNSLALSQEIMWKLLICDTILLKKWWFVWGDSNTMLKHPDPFGTSNEDFLPCKIWSFPDECPGMWSVRCAACQRRTCSSTVLQWQHLLKDLEEYIVFLFENVQTPLKAINMKYIRLGKGV